MAKDITEIIERNRRNIEIAQDEIQDVDIINLTNRNLPEDTVELNFGEQAIRIKTDQEKDGSDVHNGLIGTNLSREVIKGVLDGTNNIEVSQHVIGTGSKNNRRRETINIQNPITPNSQSHTLTRTGNTLTLVSDLTIDDNITVSEIGVEMDDGTLIQYDTI